MRRLSEMMQEREALEKEFLEKLREFEVKWEGATVTYVNLERVYSIGHTAPQLYMVSICVTI